MRHFHVVLGFLASRLGLACSGAVSGVMTRAAAWAIRLGLGAERGRAIRGEAVVANAVHGLLADQLDEPLGGQPVQRGVERPGSQPDPPAGELPGPLDDPVAMQRTAQQRGEHEVRRLPHRWRCHAHHNK